MSEARHSGGCVAINAATVSRGLTNVGLSQRRLSRTILTGVTTLLALGALYLWGGEVIASFTIAMIFGILIGTYSSIFVAGPLLILFKLRPGALSGGGEATRLSDAAQPSKT